MVKQVVVSGGVTPYGYELVDAPEWAAVSSTGFVSVTNVPVTERRKSVEFAVRLTDANGLAVLVPVTVTIVN